MRILLKNLDREKIKFILMTIFKYAVVPAVVGFILGYVVTTIMIGVML